MMRPIDQLLKTASEMPNDIKSLFLVTVDKNGKCDIHANGDVFHVTFMLKSMDLFVHKLINGEIKNEFTKK